MFSIGLTQMVLNATSFSISVGDCGPRRTMKEKNSTSDTDPHHVQVANMAAMKTEQMDPLFLLCILPGPKYISSGET